VLGSKEPESGIGASNALLYEQTGELAENTRWAACGMTEDNELVKDNITVNRAAEEMDSTLLEMIEIGTRTGHRGGPNRVAERAKNTSDCLKKPQKHGG